MLSEQMHGQIHPSQMSRYEIGSGAATPGVTGAKTAQTLANRITPELEPILHSLLGAVERIRVQDNDLAVALSRAIGTWPVEGDCSRECAPDRDGLIPAIAAACDALHVAIDRMQDTVNRARTL